MDLRILTAGLVAAGAAAMALLASHRGAVLAGEPHAATPATPAGPWTEPAAPKRSALLYDRFETIGRADGLPSDRTTCVLADGDLLAVGTDDGLAVRRGGAWTVYGEKDGLAHRYVTSVSRDAESGALWIGTLRGLSRLSGGTLRTWRQTDSGLMNDVVYQVLAEGPLVWAATAAGTSCLDTRTDAWTLYDVKNSIMHEPWCYSVATGPQRTWIGVWGGGVVELDRASGNWKEYRDPDGEMEIDLLRDDGPIHDVTSFVAYDDGVLWQATYFGLSRYDGRRWRSYDVDDTGLPGNFISQVSSRGPTVWIGSDRGLGVFDGETCVSYRRTPQGECDVRICRDGREVGRRTLATAPADDYVLWTQGGESDVWIATGRGLSHGIADADAQRKER
jgi:ligand-binding sensor domain-containing protein